MIEGAAETKAGRRIRLGMVGGGPGSFIGPVHRAAARLDDRFELVATALCSDPAKAVAAGKEMFVARPYGTFMEMAAAEAVREDRIDVVSIVAPNHMHYPVAKAFLSAGIHVICDKPMTTTVADAIELADIARQRDLLFLLTQTYSAYPMVRQAREMVLAGELGEVRFIQVQYVQDWLSTLLEETGAKQAEWRTDPARCGPGGCVGDLGTHAFHLATFISGLSCSELAADVTTFVPGRRLDDNAQVLLRFNNGAKGNLWASQIAVGNENNLSIGVYGERGGLSWSQENPNYLTFTPLGQHPRTITRGGPGVGRSAARATRIPCGHPEGYFEAFAQLYSDAAEQIHARQENRQPEPGALLVPNAADGIRGVRFIEAVLESSRRGNAWVAFT